MVSGGKPLVVAQPACATAAAYMELGAAVVREVAKLSGGASRGPSAMYDAGNNAIVIRCVSGHPLYCACLFWVHNARAGTSLESMRLWQR